MVSTGTIEKTVISNKRQHAPRYRVLLHNDDFNSMEYVVDAWYKIVFIVFKADFLYIWSWKKLLIDYFDKNCHY